MTVEVSTSKERATEMEHKHSERVGLLPNLSRFPGNQRFNGTTLQLSLGRRMFFFFFLSAMKEQQGGEELFSAFSGKRGHGDLGEAE